MKDTKNNNYYILNLLTVSLNVQTVSFEKLLFLFLWAKGSYVVMKENYFFKNGLISNFLKEIVCILAIFVPNECWCIVAYLQKWFPN